MERSIEARVVKAIASDFMLDQPSRRKGGGPHRRALVHDQNDGLTINFNGDYPGGVTLVGVTQVFPKQIAGSPKPNPTLVVRGAISYEVDVPTGASGEGSIPGEMVTITVNVDDLFNAHQAEIVSLTARLLALETLLGK